MWYPPSVNRADIRRVLVLFRPYRMRLGAVLGLIVLSAGLDIMSPFLLRAILDTALPQRDDALLTMLVGGMIGIAVVGGVLGVYQTLLSNQVGQRVMPAMTERAVSPSGVRCLTYSLRR